MQCPKCECVNPDQARFCNNCGQKLIGTCAHCGTQNPEGANFCSACGNKLLFGEPVNPGKRKAERRQLTVLFCDLVGSTPLSEALDAEDYREVILNYQQVAEAAIKKNGGHIAQYLGDGLLVYFGYPRGLENAPKSAVKSGLDILKAIDKANKVWGQKGKTEIAIRIGIHTGLVVVDEHLALGDTVNIAARLEGLAPENGLVISKYTQKLVSGWFEMESLGAHTLKGIKDPMEIYRVLKASGASSRIEIAMGRGLSPLVGREDEVYLLLRKWNQAKTGNGQFLILNGEAGIGKSRLVQSIKGQVEQEINAVRLEIRCSDYQTTTPFYPLIDLLENRVLAFAREEEPESKIEKLKNWMNLAGLALKPHLPIYADFLSIPISDELRAQYESQLLVAAGKRKKFMDSFTTALFNYSKEQALLFVVEDLHWIDSSTLEWFNQVVEQLPAYPIFAVATTRPQFQAPWPAKSYIAQLNLNRLSNNRIEVICRHQAKGKALPETLLHQISDKTNGVPLFVEELTRMIIDSDLLIEREDHFELNPSYQSGFDLAIPSTLQDSLMTRLDQLSDSREIAQIGSVLGRQFTYELIEAVAQRSEEGLQKDLSKLVAGELLYQKGSGRAATYLFKHALIQDAAYESLLKRRRQQLHKRAATVLEQQFPALVETQPELLAHHANEAGLNEKALEMWELAGNKAVRQYANFDAVHHFQKALSLLPCISDETKRTAKELDLLLPYNGALMISKGWGFPEVQSNSKRIVELSEMSQGDTKAYYGLIGLNSTFFNQGNYDQSLAYAKKGLTLAEKITEPDFRLLSYTQIAESQILLGNLTEGQRYVDLVLKEYQVEKHEFLGRLGFGGIKYFAQMYSVLTFTLLGYPDRAKKIIVEEQASIRGQKNIVDVHRIWTTRFIYYSMLNEWAEGQVMVTPAFAIIEESGEPALNAISQLVDYIISANLGAVENIERALDLMNDMKAWNLRSFHSAFLTLLAGACRKENLVQKELECIAKAFDHIEQTGEKLFLSSLYQLQGELLLKQGNASESEQAYLNAIQVAQNQSAKLFELGASKSLARLWQSQGKISKAYHLLYGVYSWFTEGFDRIDMRESKELLEELSTAKEMNTDAEQ